MVDFKETAARVKGMQVIEEEVRAAAKRCGLRAKPKDFAWNRDRPYDAVPDTLELSVRLNGGPPVHQVFIRSEVEQCASGVSDPAVATKIQAMMEHLQALNGKKRDG